MEGDRGLMNGESSLAPAMMGDVGRDDELWELWTPCAVEPSPGRQQVQLKLKIHQGNHSLSGDPLVWDSSFDLPLRFKLNIRLGPGGGDAAACRCCCGVDLPLPLIKLLVILSTLLPTARVIRFLGEEDPLSSSSTRSADFWTTVVSGWPVRA
jgi:hypothetical protein